MSRHLHLCAQTIPINEKQFCLYNDPHSFCWQSCTRQCSHLFMLLKSIYKGRKVKCKQFIVSSLGLKQFPLAPWSCSFRRLKFSSISPAPSVKTFKHEMPLNKDFEHVFEDHDVSSLSCNISWSDKMLAQPKPPHFAAAWDVTM